MAAPTVDRPLPQQAMRPHHGAEITRRAPTNRSPSGTVPRFEPAAESRPASGQPGTPRANTVDGQRTRNAPDRVHPSRSRQTSPAPRPLALTTAWPVHRERP